MAKRLTDLPVVVDPSHAAGRRDLVIPLSKASVAAEADGLIVESHHEPQEALCDAEQALPAGALMGLRESLQPFAAAIGREVISPRGLAKLSPVISVGVDQRAQRTEL